MPSRAAGRAGVQESDETRRPRGIRAGRTVSFFLTSEPVIPNPTCRRRGAGVPGCRAAGLPGCRLAHCAAQEFRRDTPTPRHPRRRVVWEFLNCVWQGRASGCHVVAEADPERSRPGVRAATPAPRRPIATPSQSGASPARCLPDHPPRAAPAGGLAGRRTSATYRCRPPAAGLPLQAYCCGPTAAALPLQASRCRPTAAGPLLQAHRCRPTAAGPPLQAHRCSPTAAGPPLQAAYCCRPG